MAWMEVMERPIMLLLAVVPCVIALIWKKRVTSIQPSIAVSSIPSKKTKISWRTRIAWMPEIFLFGASLSLVVAAAGPRKLLSKSVEEGKGIDIVLSIDVSNSMLTQDFTPNRMEVCKNLASAFVKRRVTDRIGLVVFGGASFTQCPLTIDHEVLQEMISQLGAGMLGDGTAVGMGLGTAVNRLKDSKASSKIIILLTDGANNTGAITPSDAAALAKKTGIKVYCIGMGDTGFALAPVQKDMNGELVFGYRQSDLDEEQLRFIAEQTGGMYFRAKTIEELDQVYKQIDYLEKSSFDAEVTKKYKDLYAYPSWMALFLLLSAFILKYWVLKRWP
ncbi:MAG: VWA domain-containing protein [Saprospiraceae bacterium]